MKTILVDDQSNSLCGLEAICEELSDIQLEGTFDNPREALEYAKNNTVDLAFLDVDRPTMTGHELSEQLRALYPDIVIVFVTAFSEQLASSAAAQADYFILKTLTPERVKTGLQRALFLPKRKRETIRVRTFGHFDVFVNDQPVVFSGKKPKELLAFIVNGASGMMMPQEAFEAVWADLDQDFNNYTAASYRKTLRRLEHSLAEAECSDLLLSSGGSRALNIEVCDCDLIDFLNEDKWAIASYQGHYMDGYTWAKKARKCLNGIKADYLRASFT